MQDDSIPKPSHTPRKELPGSEKRRRRLAKGLPPYTPAGLAVRQRDLRKNGKARRRAAYAARIAFVRAIKMERGCTDCGYREHGAALVFDHLPQFQKIEDISKISHSAKLEYLLAEIAKCEVVCANCHAVRTAERREAAKRLA